MHWNTGSHSHCVASCVFYFYACVFATCCCVSCILHVIFVNVSAHVLGVVSLSFVFYIHIIHLSFECLWFHPVLYCVPVCFKRVRLSVCLCGTGTLLLANIDGCISMMIGTVNSGPAYRPCHCCKGLCKDAPALQQAQRSGPSVQGS